MATSIEITQVLKDRYQLDPADGGRWMETDDIEQVIYWAMRIGREYLPDGSVTYDETDGFRLLTGSTDG